MIIPCPERGVETRFDTPPKYCAPLKSPFHLKGNNRIRNLCMKAI